MPALVWVFRSRAGQQGKPILIGAGREVRGSPGEGDCGGKATTDITAGRLGCGSSAQVIDHEAEVVSHRAEAAVEEVLQQVGELLGGSGLGSEMDKSARALAQSALARLDVVSREEFDAQAEILQRTRARVEELEQELEQLGRDLEGISSSD